MSVRRARNGLDCRGLLVALLLVLALPACQPLQKGEPSGAPSGDPAARRAATLATQGRHDDAAEAYLTLASQAAGETRERYLILAARERRLSGKLGAAQAILESLGSQIAAANLVGWAIVAGDLAVAQARPQDALDAIAKAPRTDNPTAAAELLRIRAQALFRLADPVDATSALLEREVWLDTASAIVANQRLLWSEYQRFGVDLEPAQIEAIQDPVLRGWLELGKAAGLLPPGNRGVASALLAWRAQHPEHPANDVLLPDLFAELGPVAVMPDRVALLLPLSGRQRLAGTALREGFMAAHFAATGAEQRPVLRIYDVDAAGAVDAYSRAVADGAQFVVGPLLKNAVVDIATAGVTVPTLALNYLPDELQAPPGLFQFALAPEDEASAAADRAIRMGQRRAIALTPNNAWGRRLLNSFAETYQGLGGRIVDYRFYDAAAADFSTGIQDILLIRESRDRHNRLSANLGVPLGFEPRRRDDIDLIFLAATDSAAKLIRPQLKFYYAGGVPTYATSAIYEGGTMGNADLNGIMFADMPWIVAPKPAVERIKLTLERVWPDQAQRRARLLAMGFDAYQLVPELASGTALAGRELPGVSGTLYLSGDRRIHRRLAWAVMQSGRPVALPNPGLPGPGQAAPSEVAIDSVVPDAG